MPVNTPTPISAPVCCRKVSQTSTHSERCVREVLGISVGMALVVADAGIEDPVEDVGDEVEQYDQHREQEGQRLH